VAAMIRTFSGTQQLHLHRQRQGADLVEKQGAAVGLLEPAGARGQGAGEGALFMTEQLRLDQALGEGAAIDGDEGAGMAVTERMDMPGDQFLAGTGFADHQHAGVARGDLFQVGEQVARLGIGEHLGRCPVAGHLGCARQGQQGHRGLLRSRNWGWAGCR